jgi:hypothetical protein
MVQHWTSILSASNKNGGYFDKLSTCQLLTIDRFMIFVFCSIRYVLLVSVGDCFNVRVASSFRFKYVVATELGRDLTSYLFV